MGSRVRIQAGVCAAALAAAVGCAPAQRVPDGPPALIAPKGKSDAARVDNFLGAPALPFGPDAFGPEVVQAGATRPMVPSAASPTAFPSLPQVDPAPGPALPSPRVADTVKPPADPAKPDPAKPADPARPADAAKGTDPAKSPAKTPAAGQGSGAVCTGDPHQRSSPTATGGLLHLAPYEVPADRVVELAQKAEVAAAENATLLTRLRELEATLANREQVIAETLRGTEAATADATRARLELQAVRRQLQDVEREDIETLRLVIEALERLLAGPDGRRAP